MRKVTVKSAKTRAWTALSKYVRKRDKICITCKQRPATQAGHYKHNTDKPSKQLGGNALWYDVRNLAGQCTVCNCYNSGELDAFALYLEEKYGHGILQELEGLFRTGKKWTIPEVLNVAAQYESEIETLRGGDGGYIGEGESEVQESWLLPTADSAS